MNLNKLKTIGAKQQMVISLVLFILFVALFLYFFIFNNIQAIYNIKKEIITKKLDLKTVADRQKNIGSLINNLKKIEPQLSSLQNIFISKNRELEFITTLEDIAEKNSVEQKLNISDTTKIGKNGYETALLEIKVQGLFPNIMEYLRSIESLNYYINIKSLNVNKMGGSGSALLSNDKSSQGNSPMLELVIQADTYWK